MTHGRESLESIPKALDCHVSTMSNIHCLHRLDALCTVTCNVSFNPGPLPLGKCKRACESVTELTLVGCPNLRIICVGLR